MTPLTQNVWLQTECHTGLHSHKKTLALFPWSLCSLSKKKKRFRGNTQCNIEDIDYCNVILTKRWEKTITKRHCAVWVYILDRLYIVFLKCLLQAAFSMGLCPVLQIDKHIWMALKGQNKGMSLLSIRKPPATSWRDDPHGGDVTVAFSFTKERQYAHSIRC